MAVMLVAATAEAANLKRQQQQMLAQVGAETQGFDFGGLVGALTTTTGALVGGDAGQQIMGAGMSAGNMINAGAAGDMAGMLGSATQAVGQGMGGQAGQQVMQAGGVVNNTIGAAASGDINGMLAAGTNGAG